MALSLFGTWSLWHFVSWHFLKNVFSLVSMAQSFEILFHSGSLPVYLSFYVGDTLQNFKYNNPKQHNVDSYLPKSVVLIDLIVVENN